MKPLLILKTGTTLPAIAEARGDFEDWIGEGMAFSSDELEVASVYEGDSLPDPDSLSGVVVTGSSALVTEKEDWSERSAAWLPRAIDRKIPLLGICYGHQLLAHAVGGRVERNPLGREIGTVEVRFGDSAKDDELLCVLPDQISVQVSHVESVVKLPPGATHHGASAGDLNQAFAFGTCAWGVQFHPEFDADIVRGYIRGRRALLVDEGIDPEALLSAANDTDHGTALLRRFGEIVRTRAE
ncbi:MAG: glutamine amidotransferase [Proteobacteria bacterium]|nr:glutamine amidotransferase [Pseudomonadota bacterium]